MNIQLMNVAVTLIEQRITPFANMLTRSQHITAMRDSFALAMPFVIVGSLMVPLIFPPVSINPFSGFGRYYQLIRPMLLPTFGADDRTGCVDYCFWRQCESGKAISVAGTAMRA